MSIYICRFQFHVKELVLLLVKEVKWSRKYNQKLVLKYNLSKASQFLWYLLWQTVQTQIRCHILAECSIWSGSTLFALNPRISLNHSNNKNEQDTLLLEIDRSKELWEKRPFDVNGSINRCDIGVRINKWRETAESFIAWNYSPPVAWSEQNNTVFFTFIHCRRLFRTLFLDRTFFFSSYQNSLTSVVDWFQIYCWCI